jgi:adhesin/invasin
MPRLLRRSVGLLALALAAITCSEAPTAPDRSVSDRSGAARFELAPSFSVESARAYRALSEFGLEVTQVRVRLTAADGTVAKDSVIAFPATRDTLALDLSVAIRGSEQAFTAKLDLLDANGVVLFSGSRLVMARVRAVPGRSPEITLVYTGPGRDVRTIAVTPSDATVSASTPVALSAAGLDAGGRSVSDLLVRWSSSDASIATVVATGNAAAELRGTGKRGTVTISAVTPTGLTASGRVSFVPQATKLVVVGGAGQTGVAGSALPQPFVVELQAADGLPVANAQVSFRAGSAGGAVGSSVATTDAAGRASTGLTLGRVAGNHSFEASSGSLTPASIAVTATPAPAVALAIASGDAQVDAPGATLAEPFAVKVTDAFGGPVAGVAVDWSRVAGAGSLGGARSVSGADGIATASYTLGRSVGVESVQAALSTGSAQVLFTATSRIKVGPADRFVIMQALPKTLVVGVSPPVVVRVQLADAQGNFAEQAGVNVSGTGVLTSGGGVPVSITSTTDATGLATFVLPTYVGRVGTATFTLTAPGFATLESSPIAIVAGPAASLTLSTQPSANAVTGTALSVQPVAQVVDVGGNAVAGTTVTAAIGAGAGSLSGTTAITTGVDGAARFTDLAITGAGGPHTIVFSSGALTGAASATITLFAAPTVTPTSLVITSGDGQSATVLDTLPSPVVVQATDAAGAPVPGVVVSFTPFAGAGVTSAGSAVTDANGKASVRWVLGASSASTDSLRVSAGGAPDVIAVATPLVGPVRGLRFSTQPPTSATAASLFNFVVIAVDSGGNTTSFNSSVKISLASGIGTRGAKLKDASNPNALVTVVQRGAANGVAVFNGVAVDVPGSGYRFVATSGGLPAETSAAFDITP